MITWQNSLAQWGVIVGQGYHYDNRVPERCEPSSHGLDCSTAVALAINRAGGNLDPCTNSWALATLCKTTPRPAWMTQLWGPGLGTQVTQEQALALPGTWWFHMTGAGHIETGTGFTGGLPGSVGAHGHETGIGYAHWFPDFFDEYYIPPMLLNSFEQTYAWKVQPAYNPALEVVDFLANDQGGTWMLTPLGIVFYAKNGQAPIVGGMITPADHAAFAGRTAARLLPRTYGHPPKPGYIIVATSGERYTPSTQH